MWWIRSVRLTVISTSVTYKTFSANNRIFAFTAQASVSSSASNIADVKSTPGTPNLNTIISDVVSKHIKEEEEKLQKINSEKEEQDTKTFLQVRCYNAINLIRVYITIIFGPSPLELKWLSFKTKLMQVVAYNYRTVLLCQHKINSMHFCIFTVLYIHPVVRK